ncbi:MAG: TIM barrel protein [Puniceicoccaceae bacterium]
MWNIGVQLLLPEDYSSNTSWRDRLLFLKNQGIEHLELNVIRPHAVNTGSLKDHLESVGLRIAKFATGATAREFGLSLSSGNKEIRKKSLEYCECFADLAGELEAGIILGSIKGNAELPKDVATENLIESMISFKPYAEKRKAKIYLEAINRYETAAVNSIADGFACISDLNCSMYAVLPDTFHMNIEEENYFSSIAINAARIDTLHISDSNRYYPGLGGFDFRTLFKFLKAIGYSGTLTLEANIKDSFEKDVRNSMSFIKGCLAVI